MINKNDISEHKHKWSLTIWAVEKGQKAKVRSAPKRGRFYDTVGGAPYQPATNLEVGGDCKGSGRDFLIQRKIPYPIAY